MKFFILSAILGVAVSAADQYADYNLVCDRNIYNGPLNGEAPFFQAFYQGLCTRLYQCGYVEVEEPGKDSTVMTGICKMCRPDLPTTPDGEQCKLTHR